MFRIRRDDGSPDRRHSHPRPGIAARRRAARRIALGALCLLLPLGALSTGSAAAKSRGPILPGLPGYSSIPLNLPGNVSSLGFEANATREFGDEVELAPGFIFRPSVLDSVRVVMSSWGCQSGAWNTNDCVSAGGSSFTHPLTVNVYAVDNSTSTPRPGALLATRTQTTRIAYRPSADPVRCTGANAGKWYDAVHQTCYNGIAQTVTFNFPDRRVQLPRQVIWTIAYNTTHYGSQPIGVKPCFATSAGCAYDALNVGAQTFPGAPYVGTDVDANGAFLNSSIGGVYCDGGAGGAGVLRLDTPCWTGFTPLAAINTRFF
jgi:hypothetical protein